MSPSKSWLRLLFYLLLGLLLLLIPSLLTDYYLHLFILICMNIILALSLRLVFLAGELSVAHAAFMGIGAYTSALLATKLGLSFWLCLPLAAVVAGLIAVPVGFLPLRAKVRGIYFAIMTLAFAEAFRVVLILWRGFTGGGTGILNIPAPSICISGLIAVEFTSRLHYYYLALILVLITWVVMSRLEHSRFGLTLTAVRESDVLSESVAIDAVKYKVIAFAIGCAFAAVAGSFSAHYYFVVSPYKFTVHQTLYMFLYLIFGGVGSLAGPVVGATIITVLPEFLQTASQYQPAIFGIILIITIWRLPEGIIGLRKYIPFLRNKSPARSRG